MFGGQQSMYGEEPIMAFCLLMASAVVSCTGKSQRMCVCRGVCVCAEAEWHS